MKQALAIALLVALGTLSACPADNKAANKAPRASNGSQECSAPNCAGRSGQ